MRRCRSLNTILIFAFILASGIAPALAQHDPHAQHTIVGWVPREILERPVSLREGVGAAHEKVTTSSEQAQAFYNQGIAYIHSYVWIEAARSFNQALRLDPKLMMAHIGLSRVYSNLNDEAAARAELARAQALSANASERERRRINLRAKQIEAVADGQNRAKHLDYKKAIDDALALDPDDVELWLMRGNAEESSAAGRGQRGGAASIAFYEAAMARVPNHFAAHHYLIHTYETIGHIDMALKHGEVYARLAPAIPHAHHMYGHDLRRVGRTEEAIQRFRTADELEKAYYKTENIPRDFDWHHAHNLNLLATSYQHQGQMKLAEHTLRESAAMPAMTAYQEFNTKELVEFLLSRGRTEEALTAARNLAKGKWALGRAAGHALAGNVLLALGRMVEAKKEMAAAERELLVLSSGPRLSGVPLGFGTEAVRPYVEALRGEILLRSGKKVEGAALLKEVQRKIRAVPGPDAWIMALFRLELIARIAREAGDWDLAEYTAKQMFEHDPAYAGTHYALALVAEHRGDMNARRREFEAAEKFWSKADADLPELAHVRGKLASR